MAIVFKKPEISQSPECRIWHLSFQKISGGDTPGPSQQEGHGDPLPHPAPSPAFGRARGRN